MRAIDADALKEDLTRFYDNEVTARKLIDEQPTIQPEIIRCKDCDWWTKQEDSLQGRCTLLRIYPTGGWFCGNARRRETTA